MRSDEQKKGGQFIESVTKLFGAINTKSAPFGERSFVWVEDGSDLMEWEGEVASSQ